MIPKNSTCLWAIARSTGISQHNAGFSIICIVQDSHQKVLKKSGDSNVKLSIMVTNEEGTERLSPHSLLKKNVIESAFRKKFGEDAELKTYEIKDFTNMGDNYSSHVTGIACQGLGNGVHARTRFVAKLNPMRQLEAFKEMLTSIFEREGAFFFDAAPKLNETLQNYNISHSSFPKGFYSSYESGKEIIITEDLRALGFRMFDRTKGLDYTHVSLTLKALAKLHSSALILKNNSGAKELKDIFPSIKDDWLDSKLPGSDIFFKLLTNSAEVAEKLVKNIKGYEAAYKWMVNSREDFTLLYTDLVKDAAPNMTAICHGDCWNNNILFRYDSKGNPVEVAMVDLQLCRIASLTLDIAYLLFTSMSGDDRMKHFDSLMSVYYEEFKSIMEKADQTVPFTLKELKEEYQSKIMIGVLSGFLALPIVLAQGDDILNFDAMNDENIHEAIDEFSQKSLEKMERAPAFKSRFLAIFDELMQRGVIPSVTNEEGTERSSPHSLLKKNVIESAFRKKFGKDAELKTYEIKDFTNRGDNYSSHVTGIACQGLGNGVHASTRFVAKLNPMRQFEAFNEMLTSIFEREGSFFFEAAPKLNETLQNYNISHCCFPKGFYSSYESGKEIIITEDLRARGFRMFDRTKGLDYAHVSLTLKALAKLHSSAMILKNNSGDKELKDIFPSIKDDWLDSKLPGWDIFFKLLTNSAEVAEKLVKNIKGYEAAYKWMVNSREDFTQLYTDLVKDAAPNMTAICHGDCWNNNILFRYDSKGNPVEVAMVDLQLCRIASLTLDIAYLLFTSMSGDDRMKHFDSLISVYYEEFKSIMEKADQTVPFTLKELKEEYQSKIMIGVLSGFLALPIVLAQGDEILNFDAMNDENMHEAMDEFSQKSLEKMERAPAFTSRFLAIFDELMQRGIIPSVAEDEQSDAVTPYSLLTTEVVDKAFKAKLGEYAEMETYEIKDFTKMGDNYTSLVTGITCHGFVNGIAKTVQFAAKLNPMRKLQVFVDMLPDIFKKEGSFFSEAAPKLNKILQSYNLSACNFPESFYVNYEKGKEILITEDLRTKGFQMFDRVKGMDFNHASLTLKALAKLHAASVIFKERSEGKELEDLFPAFKDDFLQEGSPAHELFSQVIKNAFSTAKNMTQNIKGYEDTYKWLDNSSDEFTDLYFNLIKVIEPKMKVICHGDCWNNNVLFRYDEDENPLDVALLDLQICRIGSVALDINYLLFTSMNGEDRMNYFDNLISVYYDEFKSIMEKADQKMPFTELELKEEYQNKIMFGVMSGLIIMPAVLAEGDDIINMDEIDDDGFQEVCNEIQEKSLEMMESKPSFKSRFLSIFDELIQRGIIPVAEDEQSDAVTPYSLLTTEVVEKAFKRKLGEYAEMETYEIKDFTKMGDNYTSLVTGITCHGFVNGIAKTVQFAAKLNPMRKLQVFVDMLPDIFKKEGSFFSEAAPKLNKILQSYNLSACNFPESFYINYEKGKEILITEDLRTKGFQMFDRVKGMDFNHASLTLKALAKLHAASVILKERSEGKELEDLFPAFKDDFLQEGSPAHELFSQVIKNAFSTAKNMTQNIKGYEDTYKWLDKSSEEFTDLYFNLIKVTEPKMKVICHGDCWNNNVLFRYDEDENPLDVALLDLQICRIGSVALDINYLLFTSMNGEDRINYFDNLISVYYDEFKSIMEKADYKMPFTELELKEEYQNKIMFGVMSGLIIMPAVLAEGDDIINMDEIDDDGFQEVCNEIQEKSLEMMESKPSFKSRFLSIFDELMQRGIIPVVAEDEQSDAVTPYSLLTTEVVEKAFKRKLGEYAEMETYEIKDFTKMGDNYTSLVTGIACHGVVNGIAKTVQFAAKLNPMRKLQAFVDMLPDIFKREGSFFSEAAPKLNKILQSYNLSACNFPESFYVSYGKGKEMLITEDLRAKGFQMFDRVKGMDFNHTSLTLKALAKLHAASVILKDKSEGKELEELFPAFKDDFLLEESAARELFLQFLKNAFTTSKNMIHNVKGYEDAYRWLNNSSEEFTDLYFNLIKVTDTKMKVICHGDCWNNNVLFRYDDSGNPLEVALLDLQICRIASVALDINYLLFTSMNGEDRMNYFDNLISVYYDEFKSIMEKADHKMPFTELELKEEYQNKIMFGVISGLVIMPLVLAEGDDILNVDEIDDESYEEALQEFQQKSLEMMERKPSFKSRFLSIFDELMQRGIIPVAKEEEQKEKLSPHSLLTKEIIETAFKRIFCDAAVLKTFEIKDFTNMGDNYTSFVTGITCQGYLNGSMKSVKLTAKLNPMRQLEFFEDTLTHIFRREGSFFFDAGPKLNQVLQNCKVSKCIFPESYYGCYEKGKEILVTKDLRADGFKMHDRVKGMDYEHATLTLKALAKLHAASVILKSKYKDQELEELFPDFKDSWLEEGSSGREMYVRFINGSIENTKQMIKNVDGYKRAYAWINNYCQDFAEFYMNLVNETTPKMKVICHGDCWNNNALFRYDEMGNPLEVALLDFQMCRIASVALDITYLLFTSINGNDRIKYFDNYLSIYYKEFQRIVEKAGQKMPFTENELHNEYINKIMFGVISGFMLMPIMLAQGDDIFNIEEVTDEQFDGAVEKFKQNSMKMMESKPAFKTRFLSIFDELMQREIIP